MRLVSPGWRSSARAEQLTKGADRAVAGAPPAVPPSASAVGIKAADPPDRVAGQHAPAVEADHPGDFRADEQRRGVGAARGALPVPRRSPSSGSERPGRARSGQPRAHDPPRGSGSRRPGPLAPRGRIGGARDAALERPGRGHHPRRPVGSWWTASDGPTRNAPRSPSAASGRPYAVSPSGENETTSGARPRPSRPDVPTRPVRRRCPARRSPPAPRRGRRGRRRRGPRPPWRDGPGPRGGPRA